MSWQTYVDSYLMYDLGNGRTLSSAAILGHDGSVWAQSPNFPAVKPEEITNVMNAFDDSSQLAQNGLYLSGSKYMVIQGEAGVVIRGKKGSAGVTIKKTSSALVIGLYDEPVAPGECNVVVERLADYLIEQNY
ncbi:hypothetical protein SELMODRAFT_148414 [Selaginella moellendorffii]|uniref:Profilin n=1 Tax=Selaginella moellendorffii TaxID=88036 RepID=D8RML7_SELML|nr:profilin-1 [Selaginella moellendorffii]XP_002984305.1 profilin-1 [Selaginella moellendorffii]EFJ14815.1 hypothetical protein SELMODRAFT_268848 [Selaginella moellendorffii]EFJ26558.1 hypothetical protein SELMODRAFT_148414 [Selaginella moellendorffii]|eukprot:XP_002972472.1 profilin-1 [Selaginella moellendorffii]